MCDFIDISMCYCVMSDVCVNDSSTMCAYGMRIDQEESEPSHDPEACVHCVFDYTTVNTECMQMDPNDHENDDSVAA